MKFRTDLFLSALRNIGVVVVSTGFLNAIFVTASFRSPGTFVTLFGVGLVIFASFGDETPKANIPREE